MFTKKLFIYLKNFLEVFLFFFVDWALIAALMEVIFVAFPKTYDDLELYSFNFKNYNKSLFSMFVFFTTQNSPEMMLKNYPENSIITTFFIGVIWANNIVLIGMLIGLSYYKMKKLMFHEIQTAMKVKDKAHILERMLDHADSSPNFVKAVLILYIRDRQIPEEELVKRINAKIRDIPRIESASEDIFWSLKQSLEYELVFSCINFIILCLALWVIHIRDFSKYHFFIIVIGLCFLSLFDLFNHLLFFDLSYYDRMWKTIFDSFLNAMIIAASLLILIVENTDPSNWVKIWAFFCLAKQFRLFLLLFRFNRQKIRVHIMYPFGRYLYDIFGLLIVLFLIFGTLTLNLFGGGIHTYIMGVFNQAHGTNFQYHSLNFNSILNSLITLFVVMLNNGWTIIANLAIVAERENSKLVKFIFVGFKLIVNYIFINSLIAITIQIFSEFEMQKREKFLTQMQAKLANDRIEKEEYAPIQDEDYSDVFDGSESEEEEIIRGSYKN